MPRRCPFATVEACPRFYQSVSLLGQAGSTSIPKREDARLLKFWKKSDLWPRTAEQATSLVGADGNPSLYSNFCPEVTFERFGFFAKSLARHSDGLDAAFMHQRLAAEKVAPGHPSWSWASHSGQHFTDCSVYTVLAHRANAGATKATEPWWREHLAKIVVAIVVALCTAIVAKVLA